MKNVVKKNETKLNYCQERIKARIAIQISDAMFQEGYDKYSLASEVGIPVSMVEDICNADVDITVQLLTKIAFFLNRKIDLNFLCIPIVEQ